MAKKAPGKSHRQGISMIELTEMFPDEASAVRWFEAIRWPEERHCGHCGSVETSEVPNAKPMPYWCKSCRSYFSVRTGTTIEKSRLPLRKWAFATYLYVTNFKGVSSMRLHRELKVTQKTAWFMLHRLREAWGESGLEQFAGPVEADETYMGGKRMNMPKAKRRKMKGRGAVGKTAVVGTKDRATNRVSAKSTSSTDAPTLSGFVAKRTEPGAKVFTDESKAYSPLGADFDHEVVKHSAGEYVLGNAHTQGIESFWAMLKRGHKGIYHQMSPKHLDRYVAEFAGRHNVREADTIDQMTDLVASMTGKKLMYKELVRLVGVHHRSA